MLSTLHDPVATRPAGSLAGEFWATLALGLPLALAQLAQIAINTTDVLLVGWLGAEPLASVSLGAGMFHLAMLFGIGVASAVPPLVSQAVGAGEIRDVRRIVRQGLWATAAISLPIMLLLWWIRPLLSLLGQDPAILVGTEHFMRPLLFGLPAAVGVVVLRGFVTSLRHTRAVVAITLAAVGLNAVLNYGLVFGHFGLPRLELWGAGFGSTLVNWSMFLALLAYAALGRPFRSYAILTRWWRPDWAMFRTILRIGIPIGGAILLEVGMFAAATLLMGLIGTNQLAAHQIALQIASISFMVPLGVSMAVTIRVGTAYGAGDMEGARRAGFVGSFIGLGFMACVALVFALFAEQLVTPFLAGETARYAEVLALAVGLLHVAALFQLVDGLQVTGIAALRGLSDTRVPMWLAALGYWGVGFPASALLAFTFGMGGNGVWLGLALGLLVAATAMVWRFDRLTRLAPRALPA